MSDTELKNIILNVIKEMGWLRPTKAQAFKLAQFVDRLGYVAKNIERDNWIPIDDKSQLFDGFEYLIQLDNNDIYCVRYCELTGFFNHNEFGESAFCFKDVKYYQPLPEPKK